MVPGSLAVNRVGAPIALLGAWVFAAGASVCHSVGWHTKGFKCVAGSATWTSYIIGAPHDPILVAARAATSSFERLESGAGAT
uniref:hypothetical protein n=1 Tax=Chrysotila carterae TaxID=13221 RepID=UPI0022F2B4A4|nr:hypothetical protein PKF17_pgp026 [Chrysotila carterae]WAK83223.1 hypothetical protein [Chrysotila carterae]